MNQAQSGILPEASSQALFITLNVQAGDSSLENCRKMLKACPTLTTALQAAYPDAGLCSTISIGAGCWTALMKSARPAQLMDFQARTLGLLKAPATPADILLHIRSERRDINFELARQILAVAGESVSIHEENPAFRYLDSRDLTGFVDGTENPEGDERADVALVGTEDPEHASGSYVLLQRFVHDLNRWQQLEQADQEKIIGRTRDTDEELDDDSKPESAHISRVVIEDDGEELEILRHSLPYGDSSEHGLMFNAYCANLSIFERMLDSMFDSNNSGVHDKLMEFTEAKTGAYFFAPSLQALKAL